MPRPAEHPSPSAKPSGVERAVSRAGLWDIAEARAQQALEPCLPGFGQPTLCVVSRGGHFFMPSTIPGLRAPTFSADQGPCVGLSGVKPSRCARGTAQSGAGQAMCSRCDFLCVSCRRAERKRPQMADLKPGEDSRDGEG